MSTASDVGTFIKSLPIVTKTLCLSTFAVTMSLVAHVAPIGYSYSYMVVFQRFQIWRLVTSFFVASGNINLVFEIVTLYKVCTSLEGGSYARRSADLAWQLIFVGAAIIIATRPMHTFTFFSPLLTCLCYMAAELAPLGSTTSFMGLVTLPVTYLPYCIIAIELLVRKPWGAANAVAGAIVGWIWFWTIYRGRGRVGILASYGQAPDWFRGIFGERKGPLNGGGSSKIQTVGQGIHVGANAAGCCGGASAAHVWGGAGNTLGGRR